MKKQIYHKLALLLTGCILLTGFSCEKENDNNQNPSDDSPAQLKVTDITLSSCIDSITTTKIHLEGQA